MNAISEFNQRAYELFGRPMVKAMANEYGAKLARLLHPLRTAALGVLRPQPLALVARAGRAGREGQPPGLAARRSGAPVDRSGRSW